MNTKVDYGTAGRTRGSKFKCVMQEAYSKMWLQDVVEGLIQDGNHIDTKIRIYTNTKNKTQKIKGG